LIVTSEKDLNRQIIKSDSGLIRIPEMDFEIPPMTQKGGISTIEGMIVMIMTIIDDDDDVDVDDYIYVVDDYHDDIGDNHQHKNQHHHVICTHTQPS
jgi:C4-type Zn-finger protein